MVLYVIMVEGTEQQFVSTATAVAHEFTIDIGVSELGIVGLHGWESRRNSFLVWFEFVAGRVVARGQGRASVFAEGLSGSSLVFKLNHTIEPLPSFLIFLPRSKLHPPYFLPPLHLHRFSLPSVALLSVSLGTVSARKVLVVVDDQQDGNPVHRV